MDPDVFANVEANDVKLGKKAEAKKKSFVLFLLLQVTMKYFFQILWKSEWYILDTFPSHLKKLRSILRF